MFSYLLAVVMTLLALPAWALGLGQLQVKSQPGQPLLAEIPIISTDPSELQNLQARLASPDTFRRVGLQPPSSEVTGLQFAVALDARGNPVIRVTSTAPLQQPQLTFLLEVDWGEGRLVREYSALVDVPRTVAAPVQPLQAPTMAPSNTIVRPPPVAVQPSPATAAPLPAPKTPAAIAQAPKPSSSPASPPPAAPPPPAAIAAPPPRTTTAVAPSAPPPVAATQAPPPRATGDYRVRTGDTLNKIAVGIDRGDHSVAQTMLALLRANPQAFIDDNINLIKSGAVLRMPRGDELSQYSTREAAAVVRTQIAQWRQMQAPQRQPAAVAQGTAGSVAKAGGNNKAAPASTGARLEIVPPSSGDGQRAGTRSGIAAGGEGDMERQQLQQTKEALAARDAEVRELKSRVADLEKLQNEQKQLIQMKESALATAQQNLAKTTVAQASTQQPAKPEDSAANLWLWGSLALLVLALLAWLLLRGRRTEAPGHTRRFDSSVFAPADDLDDPPLAAKIAEGVDAEDGSALQREAMDDAIDDEARVADVADDAPVGEQVPSATVAAQPVQPAYWTAAPALVGTVPPWHAGTTTMPASITGTEDGGMQDGSDPDGNQQDDSPVRQIELARAYLDLGDDDAARTLLREALDSGDPSARETAARMLRDL